MCCPAQGRLLGDAMNRSDVPDNIARMLIGPVPYDEFESDACTAAPDLVPGLGGQLVDISPACFWHDYAYSIGGSESHRRHTDLDFLANMLILQAQWPVAWEYYRAVRVFGAFSWNRGWQYEPRVGALRRLWFAAKSLVIG